MSFHLRGAPRLLASISSTHRYYTHLTMKGSNTAPGQATLPTANSTKSFWHSEPSKILLGHRTTQSLPTEADVVIIGSGIAGTSAAHFLNEDSRAKDLNVVMLEAREACWGATGRNGGHCQPMIYFSPPDIGAFELKNFRHLEKFVADNDIQCEWKTVSVCHAYMVEEMFEEAVKHYNMVEKLNPYLKELVSIVTKDSKNPSLKDLRIPTAAGAMLPKTSASLWPYKLIAWKLERLLSLNAHSNPSFNLQTNTPVTHLQRLDESWIVHTERGLIATKNVLLTTNAYTSYLLPSFSDLIVPVRGEMSSLIPPKSMKERLEHSYGFMGHGKQNIHQDDYLVQRPFSSEGGAGELMFGGGRSEAKGAGIGISDDSSIDLPAATYLRQELTVVLDIGSEKRELEASYEWSGIMGFSRDGRPWVGELTEDLGLGGGKGLWICGGFTGHGMPNACLSSKATVDMMLGTSKENVDLPEAYRLTKERVDEARVLDEVHIADVKGEWF